jgi:hypothetical protein
MFALPEPGNSRIRRGMVGNVRFDWGLHLMIELAREDRGRSAAGLGRQPIVLAAVTLLLILAGVTSIALWRAYGGTSTDPDRAEAARQLQARAALVSQQLIERSKGLEITQQQSIDQLQVMQDQLQQVRKQLAQQQDDTKRLSDQVAGLAEAVDSLRQSFASAQTSSEPSSSHRRVSHARARTHVVKTANQKSTKSGG